jgi:hypothetical protein
MRYVRWHELAIFLLVDFFLSLAGRLARAEDETREKQRATTALQITL